MDTSVTQNDVTATRIARVSRLSGEEIASRLRVVKKVGRVVWRGYQIVAALVILCLVIGSVALFNQKYRDMFLPYESNVYTKTCRANFAEGSGVFVEGNRIVYERVQTFGPLHWKGIDESSETTKVTMPGKSLTVIGLDENMKLVYTKTFGANDRGDQQIKPATNLIFLLGAQNDGTVIPYSEFCK